MFASVLVVLSACTSLEEGGKFVTGPESFVWADSDFIIEGNSKMTGHTNLSDGELRLYVDHFPPGTKVEVAGSTGTADEDGYLSVDASVFSYYGSITLPAASASSWNTGQLDGLTAVFTLPGKAPITVPLASQTVYFPGEDLVEAAKRGPVLFNGESPTDPEKLTAVYYDDSYDEMILGLGKTLSDIDGLAFVERVPVKDIVCDGYVDDAGNPTAPIILQVQDAKVRVFGRRSGKVLAEKTFASANEDCPNSVFSMDGGQQKRPSTMPREEMQAWVKSQVGG